MFPLVFKTKWQEILPLILQHLTFYRKKSSTTFPVLLVEDYDWVRNPFIEVVSKGKLTLEKKKN